MGEIELLRQEVAQLRAEVDRVDEWSNGLYLALHDVLLPLVRRDPDLAAVLAACWKPVSERFDAVSNNPGQADSFDDTADSMEARKMLYRMFAQLGLWPRPAS